MTNRLLLNTAVVASASVFLLCARESFKYDPLPFFAVLGALGVTIAFEVTRMLQQIQKKRRIEAMARKGPVRQGSGRETSRVLELTDLEIDRFGELDARIAEQMGVNK